MITELTTAILDELKSNGLDVRELGFKDLTTMSASMNLTRPAVNISVNSATGQKVAVGLPQEHYKWKLSVSLLILFPHLKGGVEGEARRKEGVYKIIEAISNILFGQKLGLELENPLLPESWRNVTSFELAKSGFQMYELRFWCSYIIDMSNKEGDYGTLSSLLAKYWIVPDNPLTDSTRASDLIPTI
jgi:hypothetical protein